MKIIALIFLLIPSVLHGQIDINLHAGASHIKGNFGTEFRINHFSIGGAFCLSHTPVPKTTIVGFNSAVTYYLRDLNWKAWQMSTPYISAGILTNGWGYDEDINQFKEVPSVSVLAGLKIYPRDLFCSHVSRRWSVTTGAGIEANKFRKWLAWEFVVNYTLWK